MANYLIIGGSSGIGQALVNQLVEENNTVHASYFTGENLTKHPNVHYFKHDVRDEFSTELDLPESIDGLVYCPGAIDLKPFHRMSPESFLKDYELQVVGAIRVIQSVLPKLLKSLAPSIVLFSTVAVQSGFPFHTKVSASKGAVEGLTKALSAEYASRVRVNAIAPSLTNTPLAKRLLNSEDKKQANAERNPMKKIGQAEDLANMANFLLSSKSGWVTGQIMHVDGGMSNLKVN